MPTTQDVQRLRKNTTDLNIFQTFQQEDSEFADYVNSVQERFPNMSELQKFNFETDMLDTFYDVSTAPVDPEIARTGRDMIQTTPQLNLTQRLKGAAQAAVSFPGEVAGLAKGLAPEIGLIGGAAVGMALGGPLGGIAGAGIGAGLGKEAQISAERLAGVQVPPGEEAKEVGREAIKGGLAQVIGGVVVKGIKLAAPVPKRVFSFLTKAERESFDIAFENPEIVRKLMRSPEARAAGLTKLIADSGKSLTNLKKKANDVYEKGFNVIIDKAEGLFLKKQELIGGIPEVLKKFIPGISGETFRGVGLTSVKGKPLDFGGSVLTDKVEQKAVNSLVSDMRGWKDLSVKSVNILRQRMGNAYKPNGSKKYNAIVSSLYNDVNESLFRKVPGLRILNRGYARRQDLIKSLSKVIESASVDTKLFSALKSNKIILKNLFKELEEETGDQILKEAATLKAGQDFSDVISQRLLTFFISGFGLVSGSLPKVAAGFAITSPRLAGEITTLLGRIAPSLRPLGEAVIKAEPLQRTAILNLLQALQSEERIESEEITNQESP